MNAILEPYVLAHGETLQFILFFALLAVFGVVEALVPARLEPRRKRRWTTNFLLTAINVVVMSLLPVSFFSVALWSAPRHVGVLANAALPGALFLVAHLLARGFISFFTHYLSHKLPWLWRVHRVHHLDTELDISTTVRFHPLEFVVNLALGVPLVLALGLSPWVLLLYEVLDAAVTLVSHANVRLPRRVERALRPVFVTPDLHRIHHSARQSETDSNFSAVFPVWDWIFGTLRVEPQQPHATMRLGLDEVRDGRQDRLTWLLASPGVPLDASAGPSPAAGEEGPRRLS